MFTLKIKFCRFSLGKNMSLNLLSIFVCFIGIARLFRVLKETNLINEYSTCWELNYLSQIFRKTLLSALKLSQNFLRIPINY